MSTYTYLGMDVTTPIGSINSYMGTSDPDGWVICDGLIRTNDGKYNSLLNMAIGTGTHGTTSDPGEYRPPDLKSNYFRGGSSSTSIKYYLGSSSVTLSTANLPSHTHTLSPYDPGHTHDVTYFDSTTIRYMGAANLRTNEVYGTIGQKKTDGANARTFTASSTGTGITMSAGYAGSSHAIPLTPSYVYVNYILKY